MEINSGGLARILKARRQICGTARKRVCSMLKRLYTLYTQTKHAPTLDRGRCRPEAAQSDYCNAVARGAAIPQTMRIIEHPSSKPNMWPSKDHAKGGNVQLGSSCSLRWLARIPSQTLTILNVATRGPLARHRLHSMRISIYISFCIRS